MSKRTDAVLRYVAAVSDPGDPTVAAVAPVLAEDVSIKTPLGDVTGKADVLASLAQPSNALPLATATWGSPSEEGDAASVSAAMPPGMAIGSIEYMFSFDIDDRISRVAQQVRLAPPGPPPKPTLVHLTQEMTDALAGALLNRRPVVVAYVDGDGQPHLSYRGSTQVLSTDQLAMWVRDPNGGLVKAIPDQPKLALLYRDFETRTHYQFLGRGWVTSDEATRRAVYDASPEPERNFDSDQRGAAIVVDVDRVEGAVAGVQFRMARDAAG